MQFRRGERDSLAADCRRLEALGYLGEVASIQLLRGEAREFERIRSRRDEDAYQRALRLGLAPADEATTRRLMEAADELAKSIPLERWQRRWVGVAQLRAGRPAEAKASLLASINNESGWHFNVLPWAVLALACHQLGEHDAAERWLHKAEDSLNALARVAPQDLPRTMEHGTFFLNDWLLACLFSREAEALLHGPERAAAELAAVASPRHEHADTLAARVKSQLDRAIGAAAADPLPWIKRGRWHLARGEHQNADADFAKAASLAPNELNPFLAAGWWLMGPYPPDLDEFCPPEIDPDPAKPMYVVDPRTGLSKRPQPWRSFSTAELGRADLAGMPGGSAYALACVYSPQERTVLLRVEGTRQLRLWVNGQMVFKTENWLGRFFQGSSVPVVLRAGRNIILAKAPAPSAFVVRVGETPADRAVAFAERRMWAEAAELFAAGAREPLQSDSVAACEFAKIALLTGKDEIYRTQCLDAYERFRAGDRFARHNVGSVAALAPNPLLTAHYDELVQLALSLPDPAAGSPNVGQQGRALLSAAWAALQTDRLSDAESRLAQLPSLEWIQRLALPARAILAEKTGRHDQAIQWLEQAFDRIEQSLSPNQIGYLPNATVDLIQVRAAERAVSGGTAKFDALFEAAHQQSLAAWKSADPLTAAFDHRVLTQKAAPQIGSKAAVIMARAQRLVELKRFEEAEADFNEAAKLAPKDPDVLAGLAVFLAGRGRAEQAGSGFIAALECYSAEATSRGDRQRMLLEIARHDDVFARVVEQRNDDYALCMMRMIRYLRLGNGPLALRQAERAAALHPRYDSLAIFRLCGEAAEFERRRATAPATSRPVQQCWELGLAPTNEAQTAALLAAAEKIANQNRQVVGLAQLRAGRLQEAVATLEAALLRTGWHRNAYVWPLLAMAEHRLGNTERSRDWLNKAEFVLQMHEQAAARGWLDTISPTHALHAQDWLLAVVFYCEARALIDGTQFADEARTLLSRWADTARQQAAGGSALAMPVAGPQQRPGN